MTEKKPVEIKVIRKNRWGHRFILEPKERIKFRERCKYNELGTICKKCYTCYTQDGVLLGCTPDVSCPRLMRWDRKHGLEQPFTMVENEYPDLKPTTFTWHPATQSPGTKRVVIVFMVKGHEKSYYDFSVVKFLSPGVEPATCAFKTADGTKKLAIAWAYYDEIIKGIAEKMIRRAEFHALAWWPDKDNNKKKE